MRLDIQQALSVEGDPYWGEMWDSLDPVDKALAVAAAACAVAALFLATVFL